MANKIVAYSIIYYLKIIFLNNYLSSNLLKKIFKMVDDSKLAEFDGKLKDSLYIGGNAPSIVDAETFEALKKENKIPDQEKYPNVWAWYSLIAIYEDEVVESWKAQHQHQHHHHKKDEKKKEEKKEDAGDDDFDPFAEQTEEEKKDLEAAKHHKGEKKKDKKVEAQRSLVLLEIKGFESDQDLDALAKKIQKEIKKDGLKWKEEYNLKEIAFGIKKILMGVIVEDEKVSVDDDIIEPLLQWEEEVQSVDIVSFDKL